MHIIKSLISWWVVEMPLLNDFKTGLEPFVAAFYVVFFFFHFTCPQDVVIILLLSCSLESF